MKNSRHRDCFGSRSDFSKTFAGVAPVKLVDGSAGLSAVGPLGLVVGEPFMGAIQQLTMAKWPTWYASQYDALVGRPQVAATVLAQDENNLARVWREGRAQLGWL